MGTTRTFYGTGMAAGNQRPVAVITPAEQVNILGSVIRLDGRGSYDPESVSLASYTWSLAEVPIGSALTDTDIDPLDATSSTVSITPDVTGYYRLTLVVSDGELDSLPAEGSVFIGAVLAPVCSDIIPDAKHMFRWTSDFLGLLENREMLPILWSGLTQVWGGEFLKLLQVSYNKSISDAQELFQRRWMNYDPLLRLDPARHHVILGNQQDGVEAYTGSAGTICKAVLIAAQDLVVLDGTVSESLVGQELQVIDSNGAAPGNNGTYTIARLLPSFNGYRLSGSTLLPDLASDTLASGNDLVAIAGSAEVRSATTNFAALVGFEAGDYLRFEGAFYEVGAIGLADGLPDDNTVRLSATLSFGGTYSFTLYNLVTLLVDAADSTYTDTFYLPQAEGDLSALNSGDVSGFARILGISNIVVGVARTYEDAVGRTIRVSSSHNNGSFVIGSVNESGDGYTITGAFEGDFPQEDVSFTIEQVGSADGRIVIVNGRAVTLTRAHNDDLQPVPPGGPGPITVGTVGESVLHSGVADATWRVPATLWSSEVDFDAMGVEAGDLLIGELINPAADRVARVYGTVVGVDGPRLGFEVTRQDVVAGADLDLTDEEKNLLAERLDIAGASLDALGALALTGEAQEVSDAYNAASFGTTYFNVPVRPTLDVEVGPVTLRVRVVGVVRNAKIPVHEDVVSIPCMAEYVVDPATYTDDDGDLYVYSKDEQSTAIDALPAKFVENREYTVSQDASVSGTDGIVTSGSNTFNSTSGSFLDRDVRPGDLLELEEGPSAGSYTIIEAVSNSDLTIVRVLDNAAPPSSDTRVRWTLTRRVAGNFIRFVPGLFSAGFPAPDRLWSETTFFDNSPTIEDNFGRLVSLSREDLSNRETRSTSYKYAVQGLMYTWTMGSKVQLARVGAQILLGLPLSEARGTVDEVKDDYRLDPASGEPSLGRLLVTDIDERTGGAGTLTRVYFYLPVGSDGDPDYAGVAINPATGTEYVAGDTVEKYAPLSKGVAVEDYVNSPAWWHGMVLQGATAPELRKYHTWRVSANAEVVDPRDLVLVADFVKAIKPAWTDVDTISYLLLVDTVTVEDVLYLTGTSLFIDNPGLGLEAALVYGYAHNGVTLLTHDQGIKSTRTLFSGWDLDTGAGTGAVHSDRGGFQDTMDEPPSPNFTQIPTTNSPPDPAVGVPNSAYMVRAGLTVPGEVAADNVDVRGDILHIWSGDNAGRYEIASVVGDQDLVVQQLSPALPPVSPPVASISAEADQRFSIERTVTGLIFATESGASVGSAGPEVVLALSTGIASSGVAVGDRLVVVENGLPAGGQPPYDITEVEYDPARGVVLSLERTPPAVLPDTPLLIWRESLLPNPLCVAEVVDQDEWVGLSADVASGTRLDPRKYCVRPGDRLVVTSGAASGQEYNILDTAFGEVSIQGAPAVGTMVAGDTVEIVRPHLANTSPSFDKILEVLPRDLVSMVIYDARTPTGLSGNNMTYTTGTSATDPAIPDWSAAVPAPQVGDFIDLGDPTDPTQPVSGVVEITGVGGPTLGMAYAAGIAFSGHDWQILEYSQDFAVVSLAPPAYTTITSAAGVNYENLGVVPGDVVELWENPGDPAQEFRVMTAVGGTITLTRNLAFTAARYGRIIRRREV